MASSSAPNLYFATHWRTLTLLKPIKVSLDDDRGEVVLIQTASDPKAENVSAFADRCSHADIPLSEGSCANGEIECPAHGARFALKDGAVRCGPALVPIKRLQLELRGSPGAEEIWVEEA